MKKSIILLSAYCNTPEKEDMLLNLVKGLKDEGFNICLTSHLLVPSHILTLVDYFLYDKENKLIYDKRYYGSTYFNTGKFSFSTRDAGNPNTTLPILSEIYSGIKYCKSKGFEIVHYLEYDTILDAEGYITLDLNEHELIHKDIGCIAYQESDDYILTNYFVLNLNHYNLSDFDYDEEKIKNRLLKYGIIETLVYETHIKPYKHQIYPSIEIRSGGFQTQQSQFEELRWGILFYLKGELHCMLYNSTPTVKNYEILYGNIRLEKHHSTQGEWSYFPIPGNPHEVKIYCNNTLYQHYNLTDNKVVEEIKKYTNYTLI